MFMFLFVSVFTFVFAGGYKWAWFHWVGEFSGANWVRGGEGRHVQVGAGADAGDDAGDDVDVDVDADAGDDADAVVDVDADADHKDDAISYAVAMLLTTYFRHILNSIVESEAIYLECLSVSLQYMKAMKVKWWDLQWWWFCKD